ncbi:ADP-ribosylglycohydrolase family protein [Lacticaseibacillus nasuensis]|uniref:ADP-ribosylglycohydrolase family protein n=1 Tax=Lacticaseibacillus nasuensis TaxID=944671 RepID=UPI0022464C02|nr:ADP-ribosylglycohydrolase family protein [Lacticaseibacillus nasuensis]MCX2456010.1 ADP-ribosylglycohydrolase family protein [Lacticaseibacillus nasuensis]
MTTYTQIVNFFHTSMIADAIGVPVEFRLRDRYNVTGMTGHGTYNQPAGTWSDDSSLTLALAETLVQGEGPNELMLRFAAYLTTGDYTPAGVCFDIGNTTRTAILRSVDAGVRATAAGLRSPAANGNGALMRVAPLAFALKRLAWPARRAQITAYTSMTHGHERSIIASCLYVETLRELLAGRELTAALAAAWAEIASSGFSNAELAEFDQLMAPQFLAKPRTAIHSSGYVIDSLEAAVWCAGNAMTLADAMLTAANLGEDTDTIAQIAACLYQAGHLTEQAPASWQQQLIRTPQSEQIITHFAQRFGD